MKLAVIMFDESLGSASIMTFAPGPARRWLLMLRALYKAAQAGVVKFYSTLAADI
jgi:hypothetical protein